MKKVLVSFSGWVEIDAADLEMMNVNDCTIKTADKIEDLNSGDYVVKSLAEVIQKGLDEGYDNISVEVIED